MNQLIALAVLVALGMALCAWRFRRRGLDRWLVPYVLAASKRRSQRPGENVHLLLCIADHFEPQQGGTMPAVARARVERWLQEYPRRFASFRDSDGRPPRHTFFYPQDEYDAERVDALAELCRRGFGEVEVHLHHDGDSAERLHEKLRGFKDLLAQRHGLLARDRCTGELAFAFIHGNWALCNSRPDGRWCGVNNELTVLRQTGCYADFTMPSAPSPTQSRKVNSIYYAWDDPRRPRAHDRGIDVGTSPAPWHALLLIQGPLLLDWSRRKWGLAPRLENGCLQAGQPPSTRRLRLWLKARVQAPSRPDWFFVKLHTHGAVEKNADVLLGESMVRFHQELARQAEADTNFHFHYVTAREMFNLVKAAEAGWAGSVAGARDYALVWNGNCAPVEVPAAPLVPEVQTMELLTKERNACLTRLHS